jgi:hypothetical protein
MDDGEQPIDNAEVLAQIRRQARKVTLQTVVAAGAITAVLLALPETGL